MRAKILFGFALPITLMLATAALRVRALDAAADGLERSAKSQQALAKSKELMKSAVDAETSLHDYSSEARLDFLAAYDQAISAFHKNAAQIELLAAARPAQVERVERAVALFVRWRAEVAEPTIRYAKEPGLPADAEREQALARQGRALIGSIRSVLVECARAEEDVLRDRTLRDAELVRWSRTLAIVEPGVAIALGMMVAIWLAASVTRSLRGITQAAERFEAGHLDASAPDASKDEFGRLGRALNAMGTRLASQGQQASRLARLGEELQACLNLEEAYDAFRRFAVEAFDSSAGVAYLINASRNLATSAMGWGDFASASDAFPSEDCWALRCGHIYFIDDAEQKGNCKHPPMVAGGYACTPLVAHGETIGVLCMGGPVVLFTEESRRVFALAGEAFALAIANVQLRERLRSESIRDSLTGLYNRRYLEETLTRELARTQRTNRPLGVMVFDVDNFKKFNDAFGHEAGDAVLRDIGALIGTSFRASDIGCRYGGEEFVVMIADADLAQLERRADRLRHALSEMTAFHRGVRLSITVSIGIAGYPTHGNSVDELIAAADAALYEAKKEGRDRVVVASSKPAPRMVTERPAAPS